MENFSDYFKNKENKREFIIAIIVIAVMGLLTAFLMLNNESSEIDDTTSFISKKTIIKSTNDVNTKDITVNKDAEMSKRDVLVSESAPMVAWIDSLETQGVKNTNLIDTVAKDVQIDTLMSNTVNAKIKTDEIIVDSTSEQQNIVNHIDSAETKVSKEIIISKNDFENKNNIKPINKSSSKWDNSNSNCVVVLGAFSYKRNLEKLKARLLHDIDIEKLYIGERKGYSAIGVYINCQDADNQLEFFRNIYNKQAWLLKVK